ncbi:MAG: hypothetical protein IJO46_15435, partial [Thermoguttaceae bacterium]|nr:hypothetical protein [Thermoguttaceae bacterium]
VYRRRKRSALTFAFAFSLLRRTRKDENAAEPQGFDGVFAYLQETPRQTRRQDEKTRCLKKL